MQPDKKNDSEILKDFKDTVDKNYFLKPRIKTYFILRNKEKKTILFAFFCRTSTSMVGAFSFLQ
jgi:hypothetical protein